jgi:2,5-dihydroxypyridine 5,6-dioxygenase
MNNSAIPELMGLYKHQLKMSNLEPGEICIVVTDMAYSPVYADACIGAASELGAEVLKITLPFRGSLSGKSWGAALCQADLIVTNTTHRLHYSEEIRNALDRGARVLMAGRELQVMERLKGDLEVVRRSKAGASLMRKYDYIRISSDEGTDLVMERGDRPVLANYGLADEPGHLDFWGAGMVQTAQLEGTLNGTMVLDTGDHMFYMGRYVNSPVKVKFRKGRVVDIQGGLDAFLLRKHLESYDEESAWMAGHTSWGTDRRALWAARSPMDAESYYGNVQIEIGSNNDVVFQGKNQSRAHLGHCMLNCSLYLDDLMVIDHGKFVLPEIR